SKLELDTNIVMERLEVTHEGIVELLRKYGIEYPSGVVSDAFHRELLERELLASFSRGEISKSTVMDRLDVSYSEVLDLLEGFRLPLPRVSEEVAQRMAKTMNDVLDGKKK